MKSIYYYIKITKKKQNKKTKKNQKPKKLNSHYNF